MVYTKIYAALIQLARAKHLIPKEDLTKTIQAIALNHLHYCANVWTTAGSTATGLIFISIRMSEKIAGEDFYEYNFATLAKNKLQTIHNKIDHKSSSVYINGIGACYTT